MVGSLATYARLATFMVTVSEQCRLWEGGSEFIVLQLLPGSAEHCAENEFNPPKDWGVILTRLFTSGGCSDLIFSGHMMYTIIVTCGICEKNAVCAVRTGDHFQSDIVATSTSRYLCSCLPSCKPSLLWPLDRIIVLMW